MNAAAFASVSSPQGADTESGRHAATLLLAVTPLLVASDSATHGAILALATLLVLLTVGLVHWVCRKLNDNTTRRAIGIMTAAGAVAWVDLLVRGIVPAGHASLAANVPLLAIAAYAMWYTTPQVSNIGSMWLDSLRTSLLLVGLPLLIGALRELCAHASLFAGANSAGLPSSWETHWSGRAIDGLLIAQRAPTAWLFLALLIALLRGARPKRATPPARGPA
ncbi:MAG: Rnf-Nqr domain containing protein [Tahibacter sp.]